MAVHERAELRDRTGVFRDRAHAGAVLAEMLAPYGGSDAVVLAIPAGGVPVAAPLARSLELPLGVAVVSKITLPWNSEVGYGAVASSGTVRLNEALIAALALAEDEVRRGVAATLVKVRRRAAAMQGDRPALDLAGRCGIVVDDGLASGFTMHTAAAALRECGLARLVVAVPTASERALELLETEVDDLHCANLRRGGSFAVADAYQEWRDVDEDEARAILEESQRIRPDRP